LGAHAVAWLTNKFKSALPGNLVRPLDPVDRIRSPLDPVDCVPEQLKPVDGVPQPLAPADCVPEGLPVHRVEVLEQLAAELPAVSDALRYRDNFARLLPERIEEVAVEIRSGNRPAAETALLSLSVGSRMVGAPRLEYVVGRCLADVRSGRNSDCLPALIREAERFLTHVGETFSAEAHPRGTGRHRLDS
jgi:hypothetical protein